VKVANLSHVKDPVKGLAGIKTATGKLSKGVSGEKGQILKGSGRKDAKRRLAKYRASRG